MCVLAWLGRLCGMKLRSSMPPYLVSLWQRDMWMHARTDNLHCCTWLAASPKDDQKVMVLYMAGRFTSRLMRSAEPSHT
jgi:hypothetical protein